MDERTRAAYHEAAHAAAGVALGVVVRSASIWPNGRGTYDGPVETDENPQTPDEVHTSILIAYAGPEGESIALSVIGGVHPDRAREIPYDVAVDGDLRHVDELLNDTELDCDLGAMAEQARELVIDLWPETIALAEALERHGSLSADDIYAIVMDARLGESA
ncbi:MAG: hypothetical protein ACRDTZ_07615 [Pseudonocardiaceae bacterium]